MSVLRWLKPPLRLARGVWRATRDRWSPPAPAAPRPTPVPQAGRRAALIRVEETPNPHARKFVCDTILLSQGSISAATPAEAASHPLAAALLSLPGVASVFLVRDFATITRAPNADWAAVERDVRAAMSSTVFE